MLLKVEKLKRLCIAQAARKSILIRHLLRKHQPILALGGLVGFFVLTIWGTCANQESLQAHLSSKEGYQALTSVLVGLGSAMVGATAIVFTIVLFATQTNVARMPTELFRMFSSDRRLLGSLLWHADRLHCHCNDDHRCHPDTATWYLFGSIWTIALILLTFVLAYQRALNLVNPTVQSQFAASKANRQPEAMEVLADSLTPSANRQGADGFDAERFAFFANNPGWERCPGNCGAYDQLWSEVGRAGRL